MTKTAFHDEVRIVPYREEWVERFRLTKEAIIAILLAADIECSVRHVGGTAVRGMCSKPIVDVLVMVETERLSDAVEKLSEEYLCLGECGRPERYFFSDGNDEHSAVYIHLTTPENRVAKEQLAFLELLRASPNLCEEYAALKMQLAEKYPQDRLGYRLEKGAFIRRCLREKSGEKIC